jgi:large subunit ribosomal protein L30
MKMTYCVIRVRGQPDVNYNIEYTMGLLGLNKVNNCAVIPENPSTKGMLQVIKDYCTWGEIDEATLAKLIRERGKVVGDAPIDDAYLKENSEFATVEDFAKAIIENNYKMRDVMGVKPIFRLHPPIKGYEGNKRSYKNGGALGYRGEKINDLVNRMI